MERSAIESAVPEPVTSEVAPRGRRRWWQFSLLSLLLLLVIACLIAGYVGQTRRLEDAKREIARRDETIKRLRQELGIDVDAGSALTVVDPAKVHIVALPSFEEDAWRWKIYLPPGKKWIIGIDVTESANDGDPARLVSGSKGNIRDEGEFLMEARLLRDLKGFPQVKVRFAQGGTACGATYLDHHFNSNRLLRVQQARLPKQVVVPPGQRFDVLRRTVLLESNTGYDGSPGPKQGTIVIYLEEDLPPAAGAKKQAK